MKIVFITDGNNEIGLGHIYQSKTLANYICENKAIGKDGGEIVFLTRSSKEVNSILEADGFEVIACNDDDAIFEYLIDHHPDVVIVDKLDFSADLAKRIKTKLPSTFAIFTCVTGANQYADVTVMGAMDSHFQNIKERTNEGRTLSFHGPRYLIIRPEFFRHFNNKSAFSGKVLLLLGGADPSNITCSIIKTLIESGNRYIVKVIIGRAFSNKDELEYIVAYNHSNTYVEVIENSSMVSDYMKWADVAIVSPGISFFEALKTKTPVIVFNQNQFQHDAWAEDMTTYDKKDVCLLPELLRDHQFVYPNDPRVVRMDIGNGVEELIQTIVSN